MSHGVLIGPKAEDATVLDDYEYETALQAVRLARCEEREERSIVYALHESAERPSGTAVFADFFAQFMNKFGDAAEEIQGMFVGLYKSPRFLYDEPDGAERVKCVDALLDILARGGWLADFLLLHLPCWSKKQKTPLEIMWRLSEQATSFESDLETTKQMLREWPQLLQQSTSSQAQEAK